MKNFLNKLKDGIVIGIGFFIVFGIVQAWNGLQATTGDTLTADKWNELVNITNTSSGKLLNVSSDGTTFNVGYEIVSNFYDIGNGVNGGRINATCPVGKKAIGGSCTNSNGSLGVETDIFSTYFSCYKFNITNSWKVKVVCANF